MDFQYFLFDWDGCLADTLSVWLSAYCDIFKKYNIQISDEDIILRVFGHWNSPEEFGVPSEHLEYFMDEVVQLTFDRLDRKLHLNPHAKETLRVLKERGKSIAIVSSSTIVKPFLTKFNIEEYCDVLLEGEDVRNRKPDPEVIYKANELLNGSLDMSIIIGDSYNDIAAGQNAGIKTCLYYPENNRKFYKEEVVKSWEADFVIKDFSELKYLNK